MNPSNRRIDSLDQFRGYTVAGMLFVNFSGGFAVVPALFKHHNTYCSYADTIMPHFFFAVGFALRLVLLRNIDRLGPKAALRRVLRRIALLFGLGLLVYWFNWDCLSPAGLADPNVRIFGGLNVWRDLFQTLVHIAVTSLWVLPVIVRPLKTRLLFAAGSGLLHLGLSAWFWYPMLHEKRVIDGGPPGFLTWTLPLLAGSIAFDWEQESDHRRALWLLLAWGAAAMTAGWAISCLGNGGQLAPPPFFPPGAPVDLWTMSQRAGSLSYQTFAAGFSMAVYALFVWMCDVRQWRSRMFGILGQNALAAYLLHLLLDVPFSLLKSRDAPPWQAAGLILAFLAANTLVVAVLNKRRWFLRL